MPTAFSLALGPSKQILAWTLSLFALFFCLGALPAGAEIRLRAGANRDTITVGDPITFRVRIHRSAGDLVDLLPEGGSLGVFEVRDSRPPSIREADDGGVVETRDLVITAYRTGDFEIPAVALRFQTASGDTGRVRSDPIPIVVRSVVPEDASDIRDVKPPVAFPARIPMWLWIASGVLLLVVAGIIWYVRRRRRRHMEEAPPDEPIDWFAELEAVARMGLLEKGEFKRYYTLLSEVVRRYLEVRTGVEAMERTTFEVARDLRRLPVREERVLDIEGFLSEADLVKFARFTPPAETATRAVPRARELMERMNSEPLNRPAPDGAVAEAPPVGGAR